MGQIVKLHEEPCDLANESFFLSKAPMYVINVGGHDVASYIQRSKVADYLKQMRIDIYAILQNLIEENINESSND